MFNQTYQNENDFIADLDTEKQLLSSINGGETIYNELVTVYQWLYQYFEVTELFYDFYNTNSDYKGTSLSENTSNNASDTEMDELKQELQDSGIAEEIEAALETESASNTNNTSEASFPYWIIAIVIVVVIISIGIVLFTKKNKEH